MKDERFSYNFTHGEQTEVVIAVEMRIKQLKERKRIIDEQPKLDAELRRQKKVNEKCLEEAEILRKKLKG